MPSDRDLEKATAQYARAAALIRAQWAWLREVGPLPLDLDADGRPPDWTADQWAAVWATAWAWSLLAAARAEYDRLIEDSKKPPPPAP